jgi:hypothetical protein
MRCFLSFDVFFEFWGRGTTLVSNASSSSTNSFKCSLVLPLISFCGSPRVPCRLYFLCPIFFYSSPLYSSSSFCALLVSCLRTNTTRNRVPDTVHSTALFPHPHPSLTHTVFRSQSIRNQQTVSQASTHPHRTQALTHPHRIQASFQVSFQAN